MKVVTGAVRIGGVLQLACFAGLGAALVASLSGRLWHDSRPGCVVQDLVICDPTRVEHGLAWAGAALGIALALVVGTAAGGRRRLAQVLVVLAVLTGTAALTADQARFGGTRAMICRSNGHGGCAYPAWTLQALLVGAAVGLVLGLVTVHGESVSRQLGGRRPSARRVLRALLVVSSVPVCLLGLWARLQLGNDPSSVPWGLWGGAAVLLVAGLAVGPRGDQRPVAERRAEVTVR